MGSGNDELGAVLMKSFFFAETQLDTLPDKILFYNGGAKLTVEGSDCLEDIRILEKEGVEILTCGTCLDFYGLKEKLAVGAVTNMYDCRNSSKRSQRCFSVTTGEGHKEKYLLWVKKKEWQKV